VNKTFDKQRAIDAVAGFNEARVSALEVAGHLPAALARIEELEEAARESFASLGDARLLLLADAAPSSLAQTLVGVTACLRAVLGDGDQMELRP